MSNSDDSFGAKAQTQNGLDDVFVSPKAQTQTQVDLTCFEDSDRESFGHKQKKIGKRNQGGKRKTKQVRSPDVETTNKAKNVDTESLAVQKWAEFIYKDFLSFTPHTQRSTEERIPSLCGFCLGPVEFCKYMSDWEKCKPWIAEHVPEALPKDEDESGKKVKKKGTGIDTSQQIVGITLAKKGPKVVTIIDGLENFEISLKSAQTALRKKFACSVSVQEGILLEIQGDVAEELLDDEEQILCELFPEAGIDYDRVEARKNRKIKVGGADKKGPPPKGRGNKRQPS